MTRLTSVAIALFMCIMTSNANAQYANHIGTAFDFNGNGLITKVEIAYSAGLGEIPANPQHNDEFFYVRTRIYELIPDPVPPGFPPGSGPFTFSWVIRHNTGFDLEVADVIPPLEINMAIPTNSKDIKVVTDKKILRYNANTQQWNQAGDITNVLRSIHRATARWQSTTNTWVHDSFETIFEDDNQ